jgi:4'-phosphopantetheinyl transferase
VSPTPFEIGGVGLPGDQAHQITLMLINRFWEAAIGSPHDEARVHIDSTSLCVLKRLFRRVNLKVANGSTVWGPCQKRAHPTLEHYDGRAMPRRNTSSDAEIAFESCSCTVLPPTEIHVYAVWLKAGNHSVRRCRELISDEERDRADRFLFEHLRCNFQVAHGALRLLAAGHLECHPQHVRFRPGIHGKPEFHSCANIRFNLAHSRALALYAFARGCEVGVDVEDLQATPDLELIARNCFNAAEVTELLSLLAPEDRLHAFLCCWTRKESYIKAVGRGIYDPLDRFQVTVASRDPVKFVRIGADDGEAKAWQLRHIEPAPGQVGALAYRDAPRIVRLFPPADVSELLQRASLHEWPGDLAPCSHSADRA